MISGKTTLIKALSLSVLIVLSGVVSAEEGQKRGHRGPPVEAIEACASASLDQVCEFLGRRDESISGICVALLQGDEDTLACKPTGDRPKGSRDRG